MFLILSTIDFIMRKFLKKDGPSFKLNACLVQRRYKGFYSYASFRCGDADASLLGERLSRLKSTTGAGDFLTEVNE